jgi:Ribosomal L27e protein family
LDEGTKERPYPHAIVAGIERYPLKVTRRMGQKKLARRSKVKPFIKVHYLDSALSCCRFSDSSWYMWYLEFRVFVLGNKLFASFPNTVRTGTGRPQKLGGGEHFQRAITAERCKEDSQKADGRAVSSWEEQMVLHCSTSMFQISPSASFVPIFSPPYCFC